MEELGKATLVRYLRNMTDQIEDGDIMPHILDVESLRIPVNLGYSCGFVEPIYLDTNRWKATLVYTDNSAVG